MHESFPGEAIPSVATIARLLSAVGQVDPAPKKRPKSSYIASVRATVSIRCSERQPLPVAGRLAYAPHEGPRCHRNGPLVTRHPADRPLRCHSDAGLQFTSIRDGERLAGLGVSTAGEN